MSDHPKIRFSNDLLLRVVARFSVSRSPFYRHVCRHQTNHDRQARLSLLLRSMITRLSGQGL